jgi:hypothetical protein
MFGFTKEEMVYKNMKEKVAIMETKVFSFPLCQNEQFFYVSLVFLAQ